MYKRREKKHILMSHKNMSSQAATRTAIQEIRRGEELINALQSHLQLHARATDLSKGVIQALTAALSVLESRETNAEVSGTQKGATSGKKRRPLAGSADVKNERELKKRKLVNVNSWTVVTPAPYLDGHEWRKYGQKMIQKSNYPRSYYRCTHSVNEGCLATKIVQEEEHGDSPMFRVIYRNKHTCNTFMSDGAEQIIFTTPPMPSSFFAFDNKKSNSSFANLSKQERRYSLRPINEDTNGEKFNLHNESCSSLINNSMLSDLTMAMGNEDTSSTPMIKYSPTSAMGLPDYYEFDFGDVDSILSSLQ